MKMMIINMLTARYFEEDRKCVCKWIAEYRRKSDKLSEGVMRRWQNKRQSSIVMDLSMLHCLSALPSPRNSFTQLVTLAYALSNPLANTFTILLNIPGSEHVYYLHFYDSTSPL